MSRRNTSTRAFLWRTSLLILAVILNCTLASRLLWGSHSLHTWHTLKERQNELAGELEELDQRRAALSREIRLLKTDPAYVEKVIRQRLNYVRKNEVLYLFEKKRQDGSVWTNSETESKHD